MIRNNVYFILNIKHRGCRETVVEVIDTLKKRNKLNKIADSKEVGWDTTRQYETKLVASVTEDENKFKASKKVTKCK